MAEALPSKPPVTLTIGDGTGNGAVLMPKPGATPMVDGQPIDTIEIKGYDKNNIVPGIESARLAKKQTDKNGTVTYTELSYNPGESVRKEDVDGVLIRQQDGTDAFIPMSELTVQGAEATPAAEPEPEPVPDTPLSNLEKRATEMPKPTSISLIGLDVDQSIQARAAKDMEKIAAEGGNWFQRLARGIWKGNIAHELLEEHAYKFRKKQVEEAHMMLSDETFTLIQNRADQLYDAEMAHLKQDNKLKYAWIKFTDAIARNIGGRTSKETYAITIAGDMYSAGELSNIQQYEDSLAAVRTRYEQDFLEADGVIRKNLGESLTILTSDDPKHQEIVNGIKDLVHRYVNGDIASKQGLDVALSEFAKQQRIGTDPKTTREAQLYASSLYQIANEAKVRVESGVALSAIDEELNKIEIRIGRAQMGEATQFQQTKTEKIVTWMASKNLIGTLFANEATAGTATAVVLTLGYLPQTMIRSAAARLGLGVAGGGAISGVIAGLKENARMKREYFQFMRQRESGAGDPVPGDKLREWMRAREIPQVVASELISRYTATAYKEGKFNADISEEDLTKTLAYLADAKARRAISARGGENISLIRWGPAVDVARANLDLSIDKLEKDLAAKFGQTIADRTKLLTDAQTKVLTFGRYKAQLDDPLKIALDAVNDNDIGVQMFRRKFLLYGKAESKGEAQGLDAALAEIKTQIALEATRRGVTTAAIGTGIGTILSEGTHLLTHPDAVWQNIQHALHIGPEVTTQVPVGSHLADVPNMAPIPDGQGGVLHSIQAYIPDHTTLVNDPVSHTYTLVGANNQELIHGIAIDTHGQITNVDALNASQDALDHGLHFGANTSFTVPGTETLIPSGTVDLHTSEWGPGGFWQYAQEKLSGQTLEYHNAAINASMQALRGYELHFGMDPSHHVTNIDVNPPPGFVQNVQYHDTIWGKEVYFNAMPNTATIHVPASLFSDQSIINLGHAANEAAKQYNDGLSHGLTSDQILAGMDRLHQIAFKIGYHGMEADIPTKDELQYLMDHLSGTPGTPDITLYHGAITQTLTEVNKVVPPTDIESLITPVAAVVPLPRTGMKPGEPSRIPELTLFGINRSDIINTYYGYYGNETDIGLIPRASYKSRIDPLLAANPELDTSTDDLPIIARYLDKQPPAYKKDLESLVQGTPLISADTKVVITVPAYQEEQNIKHTLEQYAKLENPDQYEIVILENHPKDKPRDNTASEIESFKKEHPEVHLTHLYKVYDEKAPIGQIRKLLVDSVLLRKQQAGITHPLILVSNDADLVDINPKYATNLMKAFASDTRVDAVGAKWDFPADVYRQMPLLHASQRLWQYFDITFRHNHLISPELIGRNSAFTSGIYAAIGGYNEHAQLAEDLEIGWLIKDARNYDASRVKYVNSASLVSNPRRAVSTLVSGGHLVQQYGDFHTNESVRRAPLEELLTKRTDFKPEEFGEEVQAIYNHYVRWTKSHNGWVDDADFTKSFDRALHLLGVTYHVEHDRVILDDISKLTENLEKLQTPPVEETPVPQPAVTPEPAPQPETEKPASLFELLDANGGTATITPEDVPLYLPTLITQLAPVLQVPAEDITTTQTHTDTTWHIEARTKDTNQLITVDLTPNPTNGFDVKLELKGFGLKNALGALVTQRVILSGLNGKLTQSEVTKLILHPNGTIEFTGKKK